MRAAGRGGVPGVRLSEDTRPASRDLRERSPYRSRVQTHHVFEAPERFVVGAVGEPGRRAFFLQATARSHAVTVGVEKAEVAALAEGLTVLLGEVRKGGTQIGGRGRVDADPLVGAETGELEPDFTLDRLSVAWDGESVVVEAAATAPPTGPDDELPAFPLDDAVAADSYAVLATLDAELDDLDVPEELDDLGEPVASLRVRLTLAQAQAFVDRAEAVVAAGRAPCVLCGQPDDSGGHFCARLN